MKFRVVKELSAAGSTNDEVKLLLHAYAPAEGSAIMAAYQSVGRGQHGNRWESDEGKNLLMSVLMYPRFVDISRHFYLSKVVSLGITDALKAYIPGVKIKWPNDIYFGNSKLGGILIENQLEGNMFKNCVAGIGINVNQECFPERLPNPLSIVNVTGTHMVLKKIAGEVLEGIQKWYLRLQQQQYANIDKHYLSLLYRFRETALYKDALTEFTGQITGVEPDGGLLIEHANTGVVKTYYFKEVSFL